MEFSVPIRLGGGKPQSSENHRVHRGLIDIRGNLGLPGGHRVVHYGMKTLTKNFPCHKRFRKPPPSRRFYLADTNKFYSNTTQNDFGCTFYVKIAILWQWLTSSCPFDFLNFCKDPCDSVLEYMHKSHRTSQETSGQRALVASQKPSH